VSSELATVAVFNRSAEAELVRQQLTTAGIESFLTPGDGASPDGKVRVQVAHADFERAMRLLFPVPEPARATAPAVGSWTCPKCGQTVFDFSSVCWLCGTARGSSPAAAASTPTAPSLPAASDVALPGAAPPRGNEIAPVSVAQTVTKDAVESPAASAPTPTEADARAPRFLRYGQHLPPSAPDAAAASASAQNPVAAPPAGPAAPRFARLKPLDSPMESVEVRGGRDFDSPLDPPATMAPVADAIPAGGTATDQAATSVAATPRTAELLPADFVVPVGPAPGVRRRVDTTRKEIESMTRWAWWTAVVGALPLLCPATIYSFWVLLTLLFARARPSRAGRWYMYGAWLLNVVVVTVWFFVLRARME
jgi:hypothetical protein